MEKGIIKYPERKQQINDFSELRYEEITPTDIDGLIEYKNKAYIILEIKFNDAKLPFGQKLAIERFITDVHKPSLAIIVQHNIIDTKISVPVAKCFVRELYLWKEKRWRKPKKEITTKECIDIFLKHIA